MPNKTTASVKAALVAAFEELGGVDALVVWGKAAPTEFYMLWAKLLPTEISGPNGGPIPLQADLVARVAMLAPDDREMLRALAHKMDGGPA